MASIILFILSIICKTLLVIGFILILFVLLPFRYMFKVCYEDKLFTVKFSYLIVCFDFVADFGDNFRYKFTFMNKIILDSKNKKANKTLKEEKIKENFFENNNLDKEITNDKLIIKSLKNDVIRCEKEIIDNIDSNTFPGENKKKNVVDKTLDIFNPFFDLIKKVFSEDFSYVVKLMFKEAIIFLKYIKPKKMKFDNEFGFDEPYYVGKILSYMAPLYAIYGDNIKVKPHFDKNMLKFKLSLIGHPQGIFILLPVLNLFLDKKFREIFLKKKT